MVRGCGGLWSVERELDEVLAYLFGPVPMFTRTRQAAMRLAEYCHPSQVKVKGPFPKLEYRPYAGRFPNQAAFVFAITSNKVKRSHAPFAVTLSP